MLKTQKTKTATKTKTDTKTKTKRQIGGGPPISSKSRLHGVKSYKKEDHGNNTPWSSIKPSKSSCKQPISILCTVRSVPKNKYPTPKPQNAPSCTPWTDCHQRCYNSGQSSDCYAKC